MLHNVQCHDTYYRARHCLVNDPSHDRGSKARSHGHHNSGKTLWYLRIVCNVFFQDKCLPYFLSLFLREPPRPYG